MEMEEQKPLLEAKKNLLLAAAIKRAKGNFLFSAFSLVFKDFVFVFLALSASLNFLAVYYFVFYQTTTFRIFFDSNTALYNWLSIASTVFISILGGVAFSFFVWQWKNRKQSDPSHVGNSLISSFLAGVATGCPVCGAYLASLLGIGGGLAAFPFQGLEIKAIALFLMGFSVWSSARIISTKNCAPCEVPEKKQLLRFESKRLVLDIGKKTLMPLFPAFLGFSLLFFTAYLPLLADKFGFGYSFQRQSGIDISRASSLSDLSKDSLAVFEKINPAAGFETNAVYGNIGPKLIEAGAIDFGKMKDLYEKAGTPLTQDQIKVLTQGSQEKIKITPENSYFLLNFLWAFGLANKNLILDEGPMMDYGKDQIGNFASTGGWTLGKKKATQLYSNFEIIKLTSGQQETLEDFAFNSYRPCCSNPTAFPDCNHGMAALGLAEILASQGAGADEIFEAFKYFNAFWFPSTYFDIARYFMAKEGKIWQEVDGREVAGKDYSTPQGWQRVSNWLKSNGLMEEVPSSGDCGV